MNYKLSVHEKELIDGEINRLQQFLKETIQRLKNSEGEGHWHHAFILYQQQLNSIEIKLNKYLSRGEKTVIMDKYQFNKAYDKVLKQLEYYKKRDAAKIRGVAFTVIPSFDKIDFKAMRLLVGVKVSEVAKETGVSESYIRKMEKGTSKNVSYEVVRKVCSFL